MTTGNSAHDAAQEQRRRDTELDKARMSPLGRAMAKEPAPEEIVRAAGLGAAGILGEDECFASD